MSKVTQILSALEQGDAHAAEQLLPLVYDELRRLAAQKLAREKPGQTLDATALVHEAYLRLVGTDSQPKWDSRGHFFAAAAEGMRRILVDNARRKQAERHGGGWLRHELLEAELAIDSTPENKLRQGPVLVSKRSTSGRRLRAPAYLPWSSSHNSARARRDRHCPQPRLDEK
jgi:RNA polymerase sigma factor (TIGR02999 family)